MQSEGQGRVLDQFANPDNPLAHYESTGPEIWRQTHGRITHFVSSMGTTGTIMGVSRYLKEMNPAIRIVGLQPADGSSIPGIRRWPEEYLPRIFERERVDDVLDIAQREAEDMRELASREGHLRRRVRAAPSRSRCASRRRAMPCIVAIVCDRGDRYLSTGVFPA